MAPHVDKVNLNPAGRSLVYTPTSSRAGPHGKAEGKSNLRVADVGGGGPMRSRCRCARRPGHRVGALAGACGKFQCEHRGKYGL